MGLGVLETRKYAPGTVQLIDSHARTAAKDNVLLVPHPSKSPNDPLNWPTWKKDLALFTLSFAFCLAGIQGVSLAVVTAEIAAEFGISIIRAETTNTYWFLAVAVACPLSSVASRVFGKRLIYLVSIMILISSAAWNAAASSFNSVLWSRIVYGFGLGAFEALPWSSIGDMYFVHQRGRRTAAFTVIALGGYQLSPVLSGHLADTCGWRVALWILVGFYGFCVLLVIFALPTTEYSRPLQYETDVAPEEAKISSTDSESSITADKVGTVSTNPSHSREEEIEPRWSYWKEILPVREIQIVNPLPFFLRYCLCIFYPAVWYAFVMTSMYLGWTILLNTTLAEIFAFPPISFSLTHMGFLNTFCLPGALVSYIITHVLSDYLARSFAKRNGNVYEPEFRLVLVVPALILSPIALALFGWYSGTVAKEHQISWVVVSVLYGMIVFCTINVNIVAFAYLLDAHREISIEAAVFAVMLRNLWNYGVATYSAPWLTSQGIANSFYEMAGISFGGVLLFSGIFWLYGKKFRAIMHQCDPMKSLAR